MEEEQRWLGKWLMGNLVPGSVPWPRNEKKGVDGTREYPREESKGAQRVKWKAREGKEGSVTQAEDSFSDILYTGFQWLL
jgi:hypothetical protein